MSDRPAVRPTPVSGFPEWLPHVRLVELRWLDAIRAAFERYGFCSVETPSAERLDVLLSKGDTSKEVYALGRVHDADQGPTGDDHWLSVLLPHHLLELCCGLLPALATGAGVSVR